MLQPKESQVGQAYATQKPAATGAAELIYNEKWTPYQPMHTWSMHPVSKYIYHSREGLIFLRERKVPS